MEHIKVSTNVSTGLTTLIGGLHSSEVEESVLLLCDAVLLGWYLPTLL
jgi:hypothetical protein